MSHIPKLLVLLFITLVVTSCINTPSTSTVTSPDGTIEVSFNLSENGQPFYMVRHKNVVLLDTSYMSFDFKDLPSMKEGFEVLSSDLTIINGDWEMPWGEQRIVSNNYNQLKLRLQETSENGRKLNIVFKVYNDGLGFRYEFSAQEGVTEVLITDENTVIYYLQKFSDDRLMKTIIKRLPDGELSEIFLLITRLLKNHLTSAEYHEIFLKEAH